MTDKAEAMNGLIAQDADLIDIQPALLPCPFCGGEQIEAFHHIDRGWGATWHIECVVDECGNSTCHHDTEANAIAAWNRRQPTQSNVVVAAASADRIGGAGVVTHGVVVDAQSDALRDQLLQECLVKLRDVQGTEAPKQYAFNLIKRIERALQEQGK